MSEILALIFGAFVVFNVFEDRAPIHWVGNLDTIFGVTHYRLVDVIYFLVPVAVFLLYGKSKGNLRLRATSALLFATFLAALLLLRLDDVVAVFNYVGLFSPIDVEADSWTSYWIVAACLYSAVSIFTFFSFGRSCAANSRGSAGQKPQEATTHH